MTRRYPAAKDDDSVFPIMRGYKMKCCDCALVHRIDLNVLKVVRRTGRGLWVGKIVKGHRVEMIVTRDYRATAACRRKRK